jgi:transposase-like protein
MFIVTDFGSLVEYLAHFWQLDFPRPEVCPYCHAANVFIGHGFYLRKPFSTTKAYRVRIKRWLCNACRRTLSLLPSFLLRYRHYLLEVIQHVVITRFEDEGSWAQIVHRCTVEGAPSLRTLHRWCGSFTAHAPTWWAAVQKPLAQHDASSPALDPLGANTGPRDAPRALLHAALHLLAWAKTRWANVRDYGCNDRLRFLWHWGAGQGLGRLI